MSGREATTGEATAREQVVYAGDSAKWAEGHDVRYVRSRRGDFVHRVGCSRKGVVLPWLYAEKALGNDHARVMAAIETSELHACSRCMGVAS